MPLAHFVAEAKKNTPSLRPSVPASTVFAEEKPFERREAKQQMAEISQIQKAIEETPPAPSWTQCKYLKGVGENEMCTQYMSLCAKEKCQQKFMEADFFDFKKYLKQGKRIK